MQVEFGAAVDEVVSGFDVFVVQAVVELGPDDGAFRNDFVGGFLVEIGQKFVDFTAIGIEEIFSNVGG